MARFPSDRPFVVAQWPGLEPVRCRWKHRTGSMFLLDRVIHVSGDSACDDHALAGRGARLALVTSSPLDSVSRDLFRYACQRRLDRMWRSVPSRRCCSAKRFTARCIGRSDLSGTIVVIHVESLPTGAST